MNANQEHVKQQIENYCAILDIDPNWACAVAMVESSLGDNRLSRTGCRGIFQMSSIAMEDLRREMATGHEDDIEILCGLLFLRLLYRRWGSIEQATLHYCDPADRGFYLDRVLGYLESFQKQSAPASPSAPPAPMKNEDVLPWYLRWMKGP